MKRKSVRVLLVEDNPADARLVKETLSQVKSPQFEVTHVERLSELEQRLARETYDVVLLDLMLADSPRLGTLMEIRQQAQKTPVVVLTGMEDEVVGFWTLSEGADDYLVKGQVDAKQLSHALLEAIARHREEPRLYVVN